MRLSGGPLMKLLEHELSRGPGAEAEGAGHSHLEVISPNILLEKTLDSS